MAVERPVVNGNQKAHGSQDKRSSRSLVFLAATLFAVIAVAVTLTTHLSLQQQVAGSFTSLVPHAAALFRSIQSLSSSIIPIKSPASEGSCSCQGRLLSGVVDDCCCEYETVDALNSEVLNPLLTRLVQLPFFRYFKVRLWCDCPFWPDDGMCHSRDCSVGECSEEEIPLALRDSGRQAHTHTHTQQTHRQEEHGQGSSSTSGSEEGDDPSSVDRTLDSASFRQWVEEDNPWTADDETDTDELTYVNLALNPERYTGYGGPSARRIWQAMYDQSCFQDGPHDTCRERRVFYRLLSGLHTSITVHVASSFLNDDSSPTPSQLSMFRERVVKFPDRLSNLYFTFLFILRAATKAGSYFAEASYDTKNTVEDELTKHMVREVVMNDRLKAACPVPFDEGHMWRGHEGASLYQQLQKDFRNLTKIMDCVGCERCRMWGKLEMLGLAASLKVLFSVEDGLHAANIGPSQIKLQRNEVVALFNTLWRFSEAIKSASYMLALVNESPNKMSISVKKVSPAGIVSARTPVRAMGSSVSAEAFAGKTVYDFTVKDIAGKDVSLGDYKGKVLLFVNVASQCGLTNSNYKGLQEVYEKYKDRGLEILAFPSNQFGAQEPGSNDQIKEFACSRYKATFPLFDKVDVNGPEAAPVYQFLRSQKGGGILGDAIKWNFGKFLVDKEGRVVERYAPTTAPSAIEVDIEKLL